MSIKVKDKDIKSILSLLNSDIPADLDTRITETIRTETITIKTFLKRLNPFLKWSPALAAGIFLIILSSTQATRGVIKERPLKEIKIEYEIKDKNIKILWVKKEEFKLNRRKK